MSKAIIYQPDKSAMQSGKGQANWRLEFEPEKPYFVDNIMGWNGMTDMPQELRLNFPSKAAAVAYAEKQGIPYTVCEPNSRRKVAKSYSDNFSYNKVNG